MGCEDNDKTWLRYLFLLSRGHTRLQAKPRKEKRITPQSDTNKRIYYDLKKEKEKEKMNLRKESSLIYSMKLLKSTRRLPVSITFLVKKR